MGLRNLWVTMQLTARPSLKLYGGDKEKPWGFPLGLLRYILQSSVSRISRYESWKEILPFLPLILWRTSQTAHKDTDLNMHKRAGTQHPLPPFLVHTWSRPAEALSLFCRSRGSRGGYTTAACRDQTYGTETQEKPEQMMLWQSSDLKLQ